MGWVAVGLGNDLRSGMAMPARIDGVDLALWRAVSGAVHAWGDRCPHRGMRLSQGFVRGETLSCIYHGWQYDSDGGCSYIPAHPDLVPPKSICATTYDCIESGGLIWVELDAPTSKPPMLPDAAALRSLQIAAPVDDVAAFLEAPDQSVIDTGDAVVVLQPTDKASCMIHVLARQNPKQTSRWAETLRKQIEEKAA